MICRVGGALRAKKPLLKFKVCILESGYLMSVVSVQVIRFAILGAEWIDRAINGWILEQATKMIFQLSLQFKGGGSEIWA